MSSKVGNITVNVSGAINGVLPGEDKKAAGAERKTLFAGDMGIGPGGNKAENPLIEQKKALAAKQAKKLIGDAWEKDSKAGEGIEEAKKLKAEKVDELVAARNELNDIKEQKEALAGIEDEKERMTKEIELTRRETLTKAAIKKGEDTAQAMTSAITDAKIEQLKHHDMVDAEKDADTIMEAANKEIVGLVVGDAKDKIDKDMEEAKEEAKKRAEKKEELEERIEKVREERKEQEELVESAVDSAKIDTDHRNAQSNTSSVEEAQKDIQTILKEHGLIDEDILGIDVDRKL